MINERRGSQTLPPRKKNSEKLNNNKPSDSDLIIRYIEKLNEVIEENKALEKKINEKEQFIKCVENYFQKQIENLVIENEDLLKRISSNVNKTKKALKKENSIDHFEFSIEKVKESNKKEIWKENLVKRMENEFTFNSNIAKKEITNPQVKIETNKSEIPKVPNIPSVPSIPNILSIPKGGAIPNIPSVPGIAPNIPNAPPKIPSVPGIPGIPGVPGIPKIPSLPPIPGKQAPNIPSLANLHQKGI